VRTSPDHGTAYDIAGCGAANGASMLAAMEYAGRAVNGVTREGAAAAKQPRKG
jgi:4-hydroxythreonine-4-phosphate dehydrogenase